MATPRAWLQTGAGKPPPGWTCPSLCSCSLSSLPTSTELHLAFCIMGSLLAGGGSGVSEGPVAGHISEKAGSTIPSAGPCRVGVWGTTATVLLPLDPLENTQHLEGTKDGCH